ncbi:Fur family transcriptional regulator [Halomicronema hongdechloris]|nr:Fur family transcriptional regulator [Halomicronema hongdechloris]
MTTDPSQAGDLMKELFHQGGFRFTRQRQKIIGLFHACQEGQHLNADTIHHQLACQGEHVSPSTIYRTLHVMVNLGLLRELELADGKKSYELSNPYAGDHHHLVCVQCGAVVEFEEDMTSEVAHDQAASQGYSILDCQFTIYGVCSNCQHHLIPTHLS